MKYILKKKLISGVRVGRITTSHGVIRTPVFMPVGTVGAVKSVAPWELKELGAELILGNTYHLYLRPGEKLIKKFGGLAKFTGWNGPMLTDSGGFQVFSLGEKKLKTQNSKFKTKEGDLLKEKSLVKITNDGVEFRSHLDGSKHFFTPEKVVDIQLAFGADIIMPLDVCPPSKAKKVEIGKAVELSVKWLKRSKSHLDKKANSLKLVAGSFPALFGIAQGGVYTDQRIYCAREMIKLDLPGYAIGGLAVGESKREMWKIVALMDKILPKNKPRYLMGVGTPDDLIKATQLGMDMFDCVLPTRLGRHGVAVRRQVKSRKSKVESALKFEEINLLNSKYREDKKPIDKNCKCPACRNKFSKAYISHLVREKEILGIRLLTLHNLYTYLNLMKEIRKNALP